VPEIGFVKVAKVIIIGVNDIDTLSESRTQGHTYE
jgi:hypothetical protein